MKYTVLTLFPEMIEQGMGTSITGRAMNKGLIELKAVNIRDYSDNKHMKVDDYPYGGGAGMVMQAEPVFRAYEAVTAANSSSENLYAEEEFSEGKVAEESSLEENCSEEKVFSKKPRLIFLTPQGKVFNQTLAEEFAKEEELIFLCGHYEGIDERVLEEIVTDNVSIGDYVLTGGELPAMVMMDAISRLVPGVLNNDVSAETESFQDNLLEYPQYSRPEEWRGKKVPEVLLSGNHKKIEEWRRQKSIERTLERRPDLLKKANLTEKEKKRLQL